MKKILFVLLLSFFFILNVKASTVISNPLEYGVTILPQSCSHNIFKASASIYTFNNNGVWQILDESELNTTQSQYMANDYLIEIEPDTVYSFYSSSSSSYLIHIFDENLTHLSSNTYSPNHSSFTTQSNAKYLLLGRKYIPSSVIKSFSLSTFMIYKRTGEKNLDYVDYEECPVITADTTLDNFYSIYVAKLKELSNFIIENKFVLSAFVIVLIFGLLASFTYLFFGRRKN